jgi:hypothetical protein
MWHKKKDFHINNKNTYLNTLSDVIKKKSLHSNQTTLSTNYPIKSDSRNSALALLINLCPCLSIYM